MLPRLCACLLAAALIAACASAPAEYNDFPPRPTDAPQAVAPANASPVLPATPTLPISSVPSEPPTIVPTHPAPTFTEPPAASPTAPQPTAVPVNVSPTTPAASPTAALPTAATTSSPAPATTIGAEILFLRGGALMAYAFDTRTERTIAPGVSEFAAASNGRMLALVRGAGAGAELWLVGRDGTGLRRLTSDNRADGSPVFAPDGRALAYASSKAVGPRGTTWDSWSQWCAASEVRQLDLVGGQTQTLGAGCDPAFSPDGRRLAFAAPPAGPAYESTTFLGHKNAIRIVNRQGQNGWSVAIAADVPPDESLLVYAPAFGPNGVQLAYQRFIGNRVEVDMGYTEVSSSFARSGRPIDMSAGWRFAPQFAPGGGALALSENNYGDARGWGGYETWSISVLKLAGQREVQVPTGTLTLQSSIVAGLPRAQRAAWAPDGTALAVQLPAGWSATSPTGEPIFTQESSGELWRWVPGQPPAERLVQNVDFASPLLWLPALPAAP